MTYRMTDPLLLSSSASHQTQYRCLMLSNKVAGEQLIRRQLEIWVYIYC